MDAPDDPPLVRAARWFQATPLELIGLAVLLAGALAVSIVLWWMATARPDELPTEALQVGPDAAPDGVAVPGPLPPGDTVDGVDDAKGPDAAPPPSELTVHVTGAVMAPGLVVVDAAARVGDAVEAAGGLTSEAAAEQVNLARPLTDGEHVHVPRIGEEPRPPDPAGGADPEAGTVGGGRIDVNTATSEQLQVLPGIGPARADAIVRHRETNGRFEVPGDLRAVPGIGEATFQQLADLIAVG